MHRRKTLLMAALLSAATTLVHAHRATERYIPIGQSPGISSKASVRGTIRAIDERAHTMTVQDERGTHVVVMSEKTRIWIDRSKSAATNLRGTYSDCRVGSTVEVKVSRGTAGQLADWIKVEARPTR